MLYKMTLFFGRIIICNLNTYLYLNKSTLIKVLKVLFAFVILRDRSHLIGFTLLDNQQRHK